MTVGRGEMIERGVRVYLLEAVEGKNGIITDVDGTLEEWTRDGVTVRLDDGGLVVIPSHNVGLVISDPPPLRMREDEPDELEQAQKAS